MNYEKKNFTCDFKSDLAEAHELENKLKEILESNYNCTATTTQDKGAFSGYDLAVKFNDENEDITIELKQDKRVMQTGNVAVEIGRVVNGEWRDTCINATTSDAFAYYWNNTFHFIKTSKLKHLIETKQYTRIVEGGDSLRARVALIPKQTFLKYSIALKKD